MKKQESKKNQKEKEAEKSNDNHKENCDKKCKEGDNTAEPIAEVNDEASEIDETAKALETAQNQAADYLDKYQRALAEFDNFRKRTMKEKASMYDDGAQDIATGLLPVIDNLERGLNSCNEADKETNFYKGTLLIYRQLTDYLNSKSITPIEAVGKTFNPNLHAAVAHIQDDEYGEGEIIEDMQKGYMYKDKVLRHSMVKVAN